MGVRQRHCLAPSPAQPCCFECLYFVPVAQNAGCAMPRGGRRWITVWEWTIRPVQRCLVQACIGAARPPSPSPTRATIYHLKTFTAANRMQGGAGRDAARQPHAGETLIKCTVCHTATTARTRASCLFQPSLPFDTIMSIMCPHTNPAAPKMAELHAPIGQ